MSIVRCGSDLTMLLAIVWDGMRVLAISLNTSHLQMLQFQIHKLESEFA